MDKQKIKQVLDLINEINAQEENGKFDLAYVVENLEDVRISAIEYADYGIVENNIDTLVFKNRNGRKGLVVAIDDLK